MTQYGYHIQTETSRSASCTYVAQTLHSQALAPTPPQRSTALGQALRVVPGCATAEWHPCMAVRQCLSELHAAVPPQDDQQRAPEYHECQGLCNPGGGAVKGGCSLGGCCDATCSDVRGVSVLVLHAAGVADRLSCGCSRGTSQPGGPSSQQPELSMLHNANWAESDLLREAVHVQAGHCIRQLFLLSLANPHLCQVGGGGMLLTGCAGPGMRVHGPAPQRWHQWLARR